MVIRMRRGTAPTEGKPVPELKSILLSNYSKAYRSHTVCIANLDKNQQGIDSRNIGHLQLILKAKHTENRQVA
jgi:hypothetical protein